MRLKRRTQLPPEVSVTSQVAGAKGGCTPKRKRKQRANRRGHAPGVTPKRKPVLNVQSEAIRMELDETGGGLAPADGFEVGWTKWSRSEKS